MSGIEILQKKICEVGFKESHYRFDLILPRALLGKGKKFEIYDREVINGDSNWFRSDCHVPLDDVRGAMIEEMNSKHVVVAFLVPLEKLRDFVDTLWAELEPHDYDVEVVIKDDDVEEKMNNVRTVGNKMETENDR